MSEKTKAQLAFEEIVKVFLAHAKAQSDALNAIKEHLDEREQDYDETFGKIEKAIKAIIDAQKEVAGRVDAIDVDRGKVSVH
jgi:phage-related minor tail protein